MNPLQIAIVLVAYPSGFVSAFLFLFWIPMFVSHFIHWDIFNPINEALTYYDTSNYRALFSFFRSYFSVIAGLFGWIALFALCLFARRDWPSLPKWIPIGCFFGAAAVLIGPYHFSLAIPPISLALALLLGVWLNDKTTAEDIK